MRMTAYEKLWPLDQDFFFSLCIIPGRVAPDMLHHYFHPFAHEDKLFRKFGPYILPVNIPIYSLQPLFLLYPLSQISASKIPGMPYLITFLKMFKDTFIKVIVRI